MIVALHLRLRVAPERRSHLVGFLREAVTYYEAPGGMRVRLLQRREDPTEFLEIVEYDSVAGYTADQTRVEHDPAMRELLDRWREILAEPAVVETYDDITAEIASPSRRRISPDVDSGEAR